MKLEIKTTFVDVHTGARYEAGTVADFDRARAEELLKDERGLVTPADPEEPNESEAPEPEEKPEAKPEEKPKKKTSAKRKK